MASEIGEVERRLWNVADQLRANSGLKLSEYSRPSPRLAIPSIRGRPLRKQVEQLQKLKPGSRLGAPGPDAFKARGVTYLATPEARFLHISSPCPKGQTSAAPSNQAMEDIEKHNPHPPPTRCRRTMVRLATISCANASSSWPQEKSAATPSVACTSNPMGSFAIQEMQKGGEFYTPILDLVDLIVEIIEPYHGRILDPACGSG